MLKSIHTDDTAKVFMTGRSQAVRLPAAFRFDTSEVFIRRDGATGDIILSAHPSSWDGLLAAIHAADTPVDFLNAEERKDTHTQRDPLDGVPG